MKLHHAKWWSIPLTLAVTFIGSPAGADTDTMLKLLDALEQNGTIDADTAEMLRQSALANSEEAEAEVAETATASLKGGKLKFKSGGDGDFKFGIHGRAQTDYAWYDEDGGAKLGNGGELRRARIALQASLWKHWHFTTQYDFASNGGHLRTVDLRYSGLENWQFQVGHFHQPFGMEHQSSSKTITFMERALGDSFSPSRDIGVAAQYAGGIWRAKAGIFAITDDGVDVAKDEGNDPWEISGRLNVTPLHREDQVLHLGIAGGYRHLEDLDTIDFRERPESHVTDVRLVDTGDIDADSRTLYGFEAAFQHGPFSVMGEYRGVNIKRKGGSDVDFDSYYGQLSYILTGESRSYKRKAATWGGVKPSSMVGKGGWGAWEIAARLSNIDLSDAGIEGGEQTNMSLALNWYLTSTIRLNANYISVLELEKPQTQEPEPGAFQVRAQYEF